MPGLVHVVDDDASFRTAIERRLKLAGYEVETYASAQELLDHLPDNGAPGCILLDVRIPGLSGPELQTRLTELGSTLPIVFLTGHGTVDSSVRAMKAGAVDFLTKPVKREVLLDAVGRALARNATQRRAQEETDQLHVRFASLTERQREVFDRIVAGKLNKQIAAELSIAERTVKREREQVMAKLGANSAADLGRLAELLRRSTAK